MKGHYTVKQAYFKKGKVVFVFYSSRYEISWRFFYSVLQWNYTL